MTDKIQTLNDILKIKYTVDIAGFNNGSVRAVRGYSFPDSVTCGKGPCHLPNISDWRSCCRTCVDSGCVTWTHHPENGCWLHGNFTHSSPVAVACGDGNQCVTGPNVRAGRPLPPVTPPSPAPPAVPIITGPLTRPSQAHLLFHEDNLGAISHFGMQTFLPRSKRGCGLIGHMPDPATTFTPEQLDTDQWVKTAKSFGARYYVLVVDHFSGPAILNRSRLTNANVVVVLRDHIIIFSQNFHISIR